MARLNGSEPASTGGAARGRHLERDARAALTSGTEAAGGSSAWGAGAELRISPAAGAAAAEALVVDLADLEAGRVVVDGVPQDAKLEPLKPPRARLTTSEATHDVLMLPVPDARRSAAGIERLEVVVDGWRVELDVEPEARARLRERATRARGDRAGGGPVELRAIIPGRIVSVDVAQGDTVEAGQRVLVVEAMKMQNELRAPRGGTVGRLDVGAGRTVELGDLLLVIE